MAKEVAQAKSESGEVLAVNFAGLQEKYEGDAAKIYDEVARAGGFGDVGSNFVDGRPDLDFTSLVANAESKDPARAEDAKNRLAAIKEVLK